MIRPMRDVLAEAMRRERLGLTRPLWSDNDESTKDEWRRRADHVIRVIKDLAGAAADADLVTAPTSKILVSNQIVGNPGKERAVVDEDDGFSIVMIDRKSGEQTVEQSSNMQEAILLCSLVLSGDPEALKKKGLGRCLAGAITKLWMSARGGLK